MAELIDVACDVCGQKYRLDEGRVGFATTCRECGTKFKVAQYTPPPDEEATNDGPLPWIKGACVAALVVASLVGLGILPFYQPDPATRLVASTAPASPTFSRPTPPTSQLTPAQVARQKEVDAQAKALREKLAGTPGMPGSKNPITGMGGPHGGNPIDLQKMMPNLNGPPGAPGTIPAPPAGPPNRRARDRFRGRSGIPAGGPIAGTGPAVPGSDAAPGTAPETVSPTAPEKAPPTGQPTGKSTGVAPVVTGWKIAAGFGAQSVRLTGRGLQNVTKVQRLMGTHLFDVQFAAAGDNELEAKQIVFGGKVPLIVVSSADGMAVVFSDDIQTIDSDAPFETRQAGIAVCRVRKGGLLETDKLAVLLIEAGGRAKIRSMTPLCFLAEGAELETTSAHKLIAPAGVKVTQRIKFPNAEEHPAVLTFCPLPSPATEK